MAINTAQLDADLGAILADLPESVTIGVTVYQCNRCSMTKADYETRKRETVANTTQILAVQISDLSALPAVNHTVTYESTVYRILELAESPDGLELRLFLGGRYAK